MRLSQHASKSSAGAKSPTLVQSINAALDECMATDSRVSVLGQDVAQIGGVFRATQGLLERYGSQRVVDVPLAEAALVGMAVGMAVAGLRPVIEIQFSGFLSQAFDQIEQNACRLHHRSRGRYTVPLVIRAPYGAGLRAPELHGEAREAYFMHTPGLKVVVPSCSTSAHALLKLAIWDDDPVLFLEPRTLYRSRESLEGDPADFAIGRARRITFGQHVTVVAAGTMVPLALGAIRELHDREGIGCELIDLLSLKPLDVDTIQQSVRRTGRVVVLQESPRICGPAAEIGMTVMETAFEYLQAPVRRVTAPDVHSPSFQLDAWYVPTLGGLSRAIREVANYV